LHRSQLVKLLKIQGKIFFPFASSSLEVLRSAVRSRLAPPKYVLKTGGYRSGGIRLFRFRSIKSVLSPNLTLWNVADYILRRCTGLRQFLGTAKLKARIGTIRQ
jgi:hypothetical protein